MDQLPKVPIAELERKAGEAAALLKALSNESRLLLLCYLAAEGEVAVGALVERVGLSQSALSQHLAKLRDEGLVTYRRQSQTLFYRIADPRAGQVLELLRDIFCPELQPGGAAKGQSLSTIAMPGAKVPENEPQETRK